MTARPLPLAGDLPRRGLFAAGTAGGRMGRRPLGRSAPTGPQDRCVEATSSFLLWDEDVRLLIDLGTGLGAAVEVDRLLAARNPRATRGLALTHYHEDHWCGLRWCGPFAEGVLPPLAFSPVFEEGFSRTSAEEDEPPLRRLIDRLDEPGFWPTRVVGDRASLRHETFRPGETIAAGSWRALTCPLPHPGGCVGFRIDFPGGASAAIATDCEFDAASADATDFRRLNAFFDGVDLLVLDVQYRDEEYEGSAPLGGVSRCRRGWGHNSPRLAAAALAGLSRPPRVVLLTHHDPQRTLSEMHDETVAGELRRRLVEQKSFANRAEREPPAIANLFDGDLWDLGSPQALRRIDYRGGAEAQP